MTSLRYPKLVVQCTTKEKKYQLATTFWKLQKSPMILHSFWSVIIVKNEKQKTVIAGLFKPEKQKLPPSILLFYWQRKNLNVLSFNSTNAPSNIFSPHCLQNQNQINDCRRDKTLKKGSRAPPVGTTVEFRQLVHFKIECEWFFCSVFSSLCSQSQSRYPVLH